MQNRLKPAPFSTTNRPPGPGFKREFCNGVCPRAISHWAVAEDGWSLPRMTIQTQRRCASTNGASEVSQWAGPYGIGGGNQRSIVAMGACLCSASGYS